MARRRDSAGWTTRTYHSRWWKYQHPVKYLASEYRKAKRAMRPRKVIARGMSFDQVAWLWRTKTTKVNEKTRRRDVQRAQGGRVDPVLLPRTPRRRG